MNPLHYSHVLTWCSFYLSQNIWRGILSNVSAVEETTDFFKSGAASMDVVRCRYYSLVISEHRWQQVFILIYEQV